MANSPVARVEAVGGSVIGTVEDVCNARVTFESGCVANITASRLAAGSERRLRAFGGGGFVSIDYAKKHGALIRRGDRLDVMHAALMNGIAYYTTLRAAKAALEAIAVEKRNDMRVQPLQFYGR